MPSNAPLFQLVRRLQGNQGDELSDGELLRLFLAQPEQSAFARLVHRHGTMVFHVCRRVLGHSHDVEDAFQATFLILVQKAQQLQHRDTVGDWLHGVAHRTALKARAMNTRRTTKERAAVSQVKVENPDETTNWRQLLDEEIHKLPQPFRQALVLCDLEQQTRREAAQSLGWQEGTVASRLARGRALLGKRLKNRGVEITAALISVELAKAAQSTALPISWIQAVTQAACELASTGTLLTSASMQVIRLIKAAMVSATTHKASILVAAVTIAFAIAGWNWSASRESQPDLLMANSTTVTVTAQAPISANTPARKPASAAARKNNTVLAKVDQPPVKQRSVNGAEEEIIFDLGLSEEQLTDYLLVRDILHRQTQEMYKLTTGRRERGLEINRDWNLSLMQIMTAEQYLRYCQYWDERAYRAGR